MVDSETDTAKGSPKSAPVTKGLGGVAQTNRNGNLHARTHALLATRL